MKFCLEFWPYKVKAQSKIFGIYETIAQMVDDLERACQDATDTEAVSFFVIEDLLILKMKMLINKRTKFLD